MQLEDIHLDINVCKYYDRRYFYSRADICYSEEFEVLRITKPSLKVKRSARLLYIVDIPDDPRKEVNVRLSSKDTKFRLSQLVTSSTN